MKPLDPSRAQRLKGAMSLDERQEMAQGDQKYNQFVADSTVDTEMDKQLDRLIDDMVAQGDKFTDQQIIDHLAEKTGMGAKRITKEDRDQSESQMVKELKQKLKKEGLRSDNMSAGAFKTTKSMEKFEDFQERAGKMMYQTDEILVNKWKAEEKESRKRRSLEPQSNVAEANKLIGDAKSFRPEQPSEQSLTKAEKRLKELFEKESNKAASMIGKDGDFSSLVSQDLDEEGLAKGENYDERKNDIVGFKREKVENLSGPGKKLTTKQKVEKELAYVTQALDLDANLQKHWYYKLKREYEAQEALQKRMEAKQARKDYRKLLSKHGFKKELENIEDYDSFYNDAQPAAEAQESEDEMFEQFKNERERQFYSNGQDIDFLKYHKRVTRNFHITIQELIDSSKQTLTQGVFSQYKVTISYIRLNRACTVCTCWWNLQMLPPEMVPEDFRKFQMMQESNWIESVMMKQQKAQEDPEVGQSDEVQTPKEILINRDLDKLRLVEAELQKKLTKAVPFLKGKLTQALGLRYAPELKFLKDNSLELLKGYEDQKSKYLAEIAKEDLEKKLKEQGKPAGMMGEIAKPLQGLLQYLKIFKKLSPGEKQAFLAQAPEEIQEHLGEALDAESAEVMRQEIEEQLKNYSQIQSGKQEEAKETRRDKRVQKSMDEWKSKINSAGKVDFDTVASKNLSVEELDKSMMTIASEIEPTIQAKKSNVRYGYDPVRGEKIRLDKPTKVKGESKQDKRKRKAQEFWNQLQ